MAGVPRLRCRTVAHIGAPTCSTRCLDAPARGP